MTWGRWCPLRGQSNTSCTVGPERKCLSRAVPSRSLFGRVAAASVWPLPCPHGSVSCVSVSLSGCMTVDLESPDNPVWTLRSVAGIHPCKDLFSSSFSTSSAGYDGDVPAWEAPPSQHGVRWQRRVGKGPVGSGRVELEQLRSGWSLGEAVPVSQPRSEKQRPRPAGGGTWPRGLRSLEPWRCLGHRPALADSELSRLAGWC